MSDYTYVPIPIGAFSRAQMDAYRNAMNRHPEFKNQAAYKPHSLKTLYVPMASEVPGVVHVLKIPVNNDPSVFECRYSCATGRYQQKTNGEGWKDNSEEFAKILKAAHAKKYAREYPSPAENPCKEVPKKLEKFVEKSVSARSNSKKGNDDMNFKNLALMSMVMGGGLGAPAAGGINPMMLMLMGDDKNGGGMDDMLPLLLLSGSLGGGATAAANNPLMLMMLMGNDCDMDMKDMLKKTLFLQMFPDATDVERGLVAEGNYKAFLTLNLAKAGLVKKPAEKKA